MDTQASDLTMPPPGEATSALGRMAARVAGAVRRGCRRYCEHVVGRVLPEAPLGGHDWFMDLSEAR